MFLSAATLDQVFFRLVLAILVGCAIGIERQQEGKPAGMRTFMLVSMGSALFVMVPLHAEGESPFASINALSRSIQGVTTGIGFLGAGLILQDASPDSTRIHGITTAASIWTSAALGVAIGCGLWQVGLMGGLLTLLTLNTVRKLRRKVWQKV